MRIHTDTFLPAVVELENVDTGHNIPAGFSQERQPWMKLEAADANGQIVYESGYLRDNDDDGKYTLISAHSHHDFYKGLLIREIITN